MAEETQPYMELYKKYRPRVWEDVIGQSTVVSTLQKAIEEKRIPTAYMFIGTHGCGKTSSAFILAKALNCLDPQPNGNPCNKCRVCQAIDNRTQSGIRYISMANTGTVDDVRKLVNEASFAQPINKPVFILDECHRLSNTAWDSLLIPLENEKSNSLFIFCSTEPDKIPSTIMSRVQARNFSPVDDKTLGANLQRIVKAENLSVTTEQLVAIVRASNGSVRDSLSNLDTVVSSGSLPSTYSDNVLTMLTEHKYTSLFNLTNEIADSGQSFTDISQQLYESLSHVLLALGQNEVKLTAAEIEFGKAYKNPGLIIRFMSVIGNALKQMSYNTVNTKILFEIAGTEIITYARQAAQASKK